MTLCVCVCVSPQADWTLVLGEEALDICVPNTSPVMSSIFVLGERNLFCLKDNGQIRFMKKLEFNPSCFLPYASGEPHCPVYISTAHGNLPFMLKTRKILARDDFGCLATEPEMCV